MRQNYNYFDRIIGAFCMRVKIIFDIRFDGRYSLAMCYACASVRIVTSVTVTVTSTSISISTKSKSHVVPINIFGTSSQSIAHSCNLYWNLHSFTLHDECFMKIVHRFQHMPNSWHIHMFSHVIFIIFFSSNFRSFGFQILFTIFNCENL